MQAEGAQPCPSSRKRALDSMSRIPCLPAGWAGVAAALRRSTAQTPCSCCCPTEAAPLEPCTKVHPDCLGHWCRGAGIAPCSACVSSGSRNLRATDRIAQLCKQVTSCAMDAHVMPCNLELLMQMRSCSPATRHRQAPAASQIWRTGSYAGDSLSRSLSPPKVCR